MMLYHRFLLLAWLFIIQINSYLTIAVAENDASDNHNNGGALPTTITEESLLQAMDEAKKFLEDYQVTSLDSLTEGIEDLQNKTNDLSYRHRVSQSGLKRVNRYARLANTKQIENLMERLQETHNKILALREQPTIEITTATTNDDDNNSNVVENDDTEAESEEPQFVPISAMKRRFETRKIMAESEQQLQLWIIQLLEEEIHSYKESLLKKDEEDKNNKNEEDDEEDCVSVLEAVQKVQAAVTDYSNDGIGLVDHAQGSEIVHSMTSPTFEAPPAASELLGNVWWRKFIPEDWEELLPNGWEDWNTGIPSMFYHSFNINGAKVSPPETVIQKKTLPGACWPMEGNRGQFTLRLPYPVFVDLFSIDHVSSLIVSEGVLNSAPKRLKVIGYPPCESEECASLEFDIHDPMDIGIINYDREGPSVQTFESVFAQAANLAIEMEEEDSQDDDDEKEAEEEEELEDGGGFLEEKEAGCSAGATACSSPPVIAFAGITVKVLENWGHPDYTCIYRFRLHGEPDYI